MRPGGGGGGRRGRRQSAHPSQGPRSPPTTRRRARTSSSASEPPGSRRARRRPSRRSAIKTRARSNLAVADAHVQRRVGSSAIIGSPSNRASHEGNRHVGRDLSCRTKGGPEMLLTAPPVAYDPCHAAVAVVVALLVEVMLERLAAGSVRARDTSSRRRGGRRWRCSSETLHPTSRRRPPKGRSASTTGSATRGRCCSPTPRTSPRSARPSSATWRRSSPSSTAGA